MPQVVNSQSFEIRRGAYFCKRAPQPDGVAFAPRRRKNKQAPRCGYSRTRPRAPARKDFEGGYGEGNAPLARLAARLCSFRREDQDLSKLVNLRPSQPKNFRLAGSGEKQEPEGVGECL